MAGEITGGEGSTSVMAAEEEEGARSLGRESCLFEKGKKENLSEERGFVIAAKQERKGKGIDKDRGKSRTRKC